MLTSQTIRVFIGSGEASLLERKTLIHSLRKHTSRPLDLYIFNGTHNAIEHNDEKPVLANLPLWIKYRNFTEFSNYRWLIPEICGYAGRAIFLDSDMVCLADIAELFDADMGGCAMLAKAEAYAGGNAWGMSNVLFDCGQCRFPVEEIFREIDAGLYSYTDLHQMTPRFLQHRPYRIGPLDPGWNSFDRLEEGTRLIHYTNLGTQPWKFPGHDHEDVWFRVFEDARKAGAISAEDVDKTRMRGFVRQDILHPERSNINGNAAGRARHVAGRIYRKALRILGLSKDVS